MPVVSVRILGPEERSVAGLAVGRTQLSSSTPPNGFTNRYEAASLG